MLGGVLAVERSAAVAVLVVVMVVLAVVFVIVVTGVMAVAVTVVVVGVLVLVLVLVLLDLVEDGVQAGDADHRAQRGDQAHPGGDRAVVQAAGLYGRVARSDGTVDTLCGRSPHPPRIAIFRRILARWRFRYGSLMRLLATLSLALALSLSAACGGDDDDEESFDNLPDCVEDHMSLGEAEAIAHCLVDFPDLHPEFADVDECVAWVTDNGGYPDSREDACADYFEETGQ